MSDRPAPSQDRRAIAALIGVQVLFGLHYVAAKELLESIPPRPWAVIRATSAALILLVFVLASGRPLPRGRGTWVRFLVLALFGVAVNQLLFVEGLHRTTPGHSALINASIPVLVLAFAVLLGREWPAPWRLVGIATTLAGVLVLVGPGRFDWSAVGFQGDVYTLCNAISYSLFLVLSKPVLERERTLPASALLLCLGALWLLPVGARGVIRLAPAAISSRTWLLALFIVLGPTIGAYALNTYALRRLESSVVAFFVYLQPLIGAGLSIALGYEHPSSRLFAAASIVFLGVFIALRARPGRPIRARPSSAALREE